MGRGLRIAQNKGILNMKKATDLLVTQQFLNARVCQAKEGGFPKAKWIEFCETMAADGFRCWLYEARQTYSKYITVSNGTTDVKIRFSNHKPDKSRELNGDCDFFVGKTHTGTRTTRDAIDFVRSKLFPKDDSDPREQQAYDLLRERVAAFGADWHVNCSIRLPAAVKEAIEKDGTDVLLLMLDKETGL